MEKIVFLDRATLAPQVRLRPPRFDHELVEHDRTEPGQVVERLVGASIAILNKVRLDATALQQLPHLRLVAVAATGTDCVDKAYCAAHGIAVANIRGYAVNTVPEHAFALMLALRRNVVAIVTACSRASGRRRASSASSTIRSATWRVRDSASSAKACSASAWRTSRARSA